MRAIYLTALLTMTAVFAAAPANLSFGAAQGQKGFEPDKVLRQVLDSAEYRELIEDQFENAEALFAGHRECNERSLVKRVSTNIRGEPEIDFENGKLIAVDLFDSWKTNRCGRELQHNFTLWVISRDRLIDLFGSAEEAASIASEDMVASFAHEDSITSVAFTIPGTTLASDEMVADILAGLTDDAELAHFEDCNQELVVVDTEFAESIKRIKRNKQGQILRGKWGEFWTLYGCSKEVRYPVILAKSSDSYDVDVYVDDAESFDFALKVLH